MFIRLFLTFILLCFSQQTCTSGSSKQQRPLTPLRTKKPTGRVAPKKQQQLFIKPNNKHLQKEPLIATTIQLFLWTFKCKVLSAASGTICSGVLVREMQRTSREEIKDLILISCIHPIMIILGLVFVMKGNTHSGKQNRYAFISGVHAPSFHRNNNPTE